MYIRMSRGKSKGSDKSKKAVTANDVSRLSGGNALITAAKLGNLQLLKDLIKTNKNWNNTTEWITQTDKKGRTVLHIACINGHIYVVRFIGKKIIATTGDTNRRKQLMNVTDNKGRTPLFFASAHSHIIISEYLIKRGAIIDAVTNSKHAAPGSTALMAAAERGHTGCFQVLVDKGADLMAKREDGADVLYLATKEAKKGIVDLIVQFVRYNRMKIGCGVVDVMNRKTYQDRTAIFTAAYHGHLELARFLFYHRAKLDLEDRDHYTPLNLAAHEGHLDFVEWLVKNGVDVDKTDKFGHTALKIAELRGHLHVANYIRSYQEVDSEVMQEFKKIFVPNANTKFKQMCQEHSKDLRDLASMLKTISIWKECVEDTQENEKLRKEEERKASVKITRSRNRRIMDNI